MNNIICCKWGTLYDARFVNNLYAMVYKNLSQPFRFICLTDNPTNIRKEVETFPIEPHLRGWWAKLQYFKTPLYDIEGTILALDLDIIIVDNIDCFFTYQPNHFIMKDDFSGYQYNSCVIRFQANKYPYIYEKFNGNEDVFIHNGDSGFKSGGRVKKYWGDQVWISEHAEKNVVLWPTDWIIKWKHKWTMYPVDKFPGKIIMWAGYMKDQRMVLDKVKHIWHDKV
jgi:hypothetical protein